MLYGKSTNDIQIQNTRCYCCFYFGFLPSRFIVVLLAPFGAFANGVEQLLPLFFRAQRTNAINGEKRNEALNGMNEWESVFCIRL